MATQGPNLPSTASSDSSLGTTAWTNPTHIEAQDSVYATVALNKNGTVHSQSLLGTNFGFSIPVGATINGVEVDIWRHGDGGPCKDFNLQLSVAAAYVGSNLGATSTTWPSSNTKAVYGGASNLWGTTLTVAQVNDSSFGVGLQVQQSASTNSDTFSVDAFEITITYTPAGGTPLSITSDIVFFN